MDPEKEIGEINVILDANALMAPFQTSINLDIELERTLPGAKPVVPTSVVRELELLMRQGNDWRVKAAHKLALKYGSVDVKGRGDSPIFNLAVNRGWPVVTMDKRLKDKLLDRGIPVLLVRGRGHLTLMEP